MLSCSIVIAIKTLLENQVCQDCKAAAVENQSLFYLFRILGCIVDLGSEDDYGFKSFPVKNSSSYIKGSLFALPDPLYLKLQYFDVLHYVPFYTQTICKIY